MKTNNDRRYGHQIYIYMIGTNQIRYRYIQLYQLKKRIISQPLIIKNNK